LCDGRIGTGRAPEAANGNPIDDIKCPGAVIQVVEAGCRAKQDDGTRLTQKSENQSGPFGGEPTMKLNSLKELFVEELRDMYDAEKQIVKALPKVAKAASSTELRTALDEHLEQTKRQVERLEQIFASLGEEPKAKKCDGIRGIIEEGEDIVGQDGDAAVRDAGLIAGAQRVEHYEMAVYGSLKTWAGQLSDSKAVELLQATLDEEKHADQKLTQIAERAVNQQAASARAGSRS
jgi:ferritin-like metal-binding protein YciE